MKTSPHSESELSSGGARRMAIVAVIGLAAMAVAGSATRGEDRGDGSAVGPELVPPAQMQPLGNGDSCPWDCTRKPDMFVGVADLLALFAEWGSTGLCDFNGNGVGIGDLLILFANWGPCPQAPNDECLENIVIDRFQDDGSIDVDVDMRASTESFEGYDCLENRPGSFRDVWYCLRNSSKSAKLVSVATDIDVFIEIYQGCDCRGPLFDCGRGPSGIGPFFMDSGDQLMIRLLDDLVLPPEELLGRMTISNEPLPDPVIFFTDPDAFDDAVAKAEFFSKGSWDFNPNLVGKDFVGLVPDPLNINNFPSDIWNEVPLDNVTFQSNLDPQGGTGPNPRGAEGMIFLTVPAFGLDRDALLANFFVDSFDIQSGPPAGDEHTAMALEVIDLFPSPGGMIHVTVFDVRDNFLAELLLPALDERQFVGILTSFKQPIGRVNIWDDLGGNPGQGSEGITRIEVFVPFD